LLFQSGESPVTRSAAGSDPVPQFFDTIGYMFRSASRYAPDNLMITGDGVNRAEQRFPSLGAFVIPKARPVLTGGVTGMTFNVTEHYQSSLSSAEWIEETPVVLDNSGNVSVGPMPDLTGAHFEHRDLDRITDPDVLS